MNLVNMLSEKSHSQKAIVWFNLYEVCRTGKYIEIESRLLVRQGLEEGIENDS